MPCGSIVEWPLVYGTWRALYINSSSKEAHEQHLRIALQILRDQQFYAKFSKYEFWMEEIAFLGYIVLKEGGKPDPLKIKPIPKMYIWYLEGATLSGIRARIRFPWDMILDAFMTYHA